MSGQPAARVGDMHTCPMVDPGPKPHVGGVILPPGAPTILLGGQPAARIGDQAACVGPVDMIAKGAMPVSMGGKPAARQTDSTAHGGVIVVGCPTVLIGLAGFSGNRLAGLQRCQDMAAGRNPAPGDSPFPANSPGQSYNNCGVESARQLIRQATGSQITQEELLNTAMQNGWAVKAATLLESGGTTPAGRIAILNNAGVPSSAVAPTMANLENAVAEGRGVISAVWAGNMPNWASEGLAPNTGPHAITVTGIEYDENGNPINVIINDTGQGQCQESIPYQAFQNALRGVDHVVTDALIW